MSALPITYSIGMALDPDQKVSAAFTAAAGGAGGLPNLISSINTAVAKNSWFETASTMESYPNIISDLEHHNFRVILDNHNSGKDWSSSAASCYAASLRYINTVHWLQGL